MTERDVAECVIIMVVTALAVYALGELYIRFWS